ncbi:trypsin-like peptidase domain-containing protein [Paenisporosarcina indica]|uniref:trypsin-like peptidase domain-containing protein n=1 Tax=Paenisporosarcina indica TaxID=650093 RepID=UPI00094F6AAD|nr:trypsin-like peptidase domain-containing protein [Paenisporosarcina indica]
MICIHCGLENEPDSMFCSDCGTQIKEKHVKIRKPTLLLVIAIVTSILAIGGIGFGLSIALHPPEKIVKVETIIQKEHVPVVKEKSEEAAQSVVKKEEKDKTQIIKDSQSRVYTIFTDSGFGSGFLFEEKGTVITNAHVVAGFTEVVLRNVNGQQTTGRVIGISDQYDVALIQVDDYAGMQPLELELSETAIGTEVIALGSPQGLENSASIGYLTGLDRSFESDFQYENVYQIDAQISPGSSGGPLLDAETGKVIGINSAILIADQSIGFSIPMYTMDSLLRSWSTSPMDATEVASVFSFYDDVAYDPDSYYKDNEEGDTFYFEETGLSDFIIYFRDTYEAALLYEDYYYIEDMILYDSPVYWEMTDYFDEIAGQGFFFDFISNEVTDVVIESDYAVVSTFEVFDFMDASGGWYSYERYKDYFIVIDEDGYYRITNINIY